MHSHIHKAQNSGNYDPFMLSIVGLEEKRSVTASISMRKSVRHEIS